MTFAAIMDFCDALGSIGAAVVAWTLWRQSRREIQRLRDGERRRQAALVTLATEVQKTVDADLSCTLEGCRLTIFNESEQVVHLNSIRLVDATEDWTHLQLDIQENLRTALVDPSDEIVRPRKELSIQLPKGWYPERGVEGQFVIVEFTDAQGEPWRRRSDTQELESMKRSISKMQDWFQRTTTRSRLLRWLLIDIPMYRSLKGAWSDPMQRPSLSTRWIRRTMGEWPIGEKDPWEQPNGAPPLWKLEGMPPRTKPALRDIWWPR